MYFIFNSLLLSKIQADRDIGYYFSDNDFPFRSQTSGENCRKLHEGIPTPHLQKEQHMLYSINATLYGG